ncbi:MAG: hypothetical protein QXU74_03490 [Candidatus Aenigmatarchaeota archaeon]
MGKMKGIFFSIIIVFLMICLITFLSIQKSLSSFYSSQIAVENRIEAMLSFYNNIVRDSRKSIEIMAGRALCSAINHVVTTGNPLQSSNDTIAELIMQGSIDGIQQPLMEGSTARDWEDSIEYLGSLQAFETSVEIKDLLVEPEDSFHISLSYSLSVKLYDDRMIEANLSRTTREKVIVSIENLEDPLYPLNTYGRIVNIIRLSPHWPNYLSDNTTNLKDDLDNSYYHPSLYGASFLDRLEGKYFVQSKYFKQKPIGLESFVNKDKMLSTGLSINTSATNVDYLYFSNSNVRAYSISGMPSNFRLDNETTIEGKTHLQIYNVTVIS